WVLRYWNDSLKGGLKYTRTDPGRDTLEEYVNADYAAVTWKANQQSVVALSTTQAEYIAHVEGVNEAIWLKGMIGKMGISHGDVIETKEIMVEKMASEENSADMFTKSLPRSKFKHCFDLINFDEE
ncbi:aspartyl-tRNA synthetase, partial [Trifolium medium]|nr:aspartyl-tRNA synthetase [Trifolium medium]